MTSRTRTRHFSQNSSLATIVLTDDGRTLTQPATHPYQGYGWRDTISDWGGIYTPNTVNPVTHIKVINVTPLPFEKWEVDGSWIHLTSSGEGGTGKGYVEGMLCPRVIDSTCFPAVPDLTQAQVDSAFKSFEDSVPTEVSLPNFLWEIGDPRELASNFLKHRSYWDRNIRRIVRHKGVRSRPHALRPRDLLRGASSAWLTTNFGLLPFIGDVEKLLVVHETVERRLNWLRSNYGKPVTVRRVFPFEREDPPTPFMGGPSVLGAYTPFDLSYSISGYLSGRHVVGCRMIQTFSGLDDFDSTHRAMTAALGFNNSLSVFWDAIPLSWIIDYLLRVGDFLENFKVQAFDGRVRLSSGWTSTRADCSYQWQVLLSHWQTGGGRVFPGGSGITRYYRREPGVRTSQGYHLQTGNSASLKQFTNLAALLVR